MTCLKCYMFDKFDEKLLFYPLDCLDRCDRRESARTALEFVREGRQPRLLFGQ